MEAYFEMYPEEKLFFVFEDGNVFFAKDKNLAEKHARDTKSTYATVERNPKTVEEAETKTTKKTK
jgi:hypothetical protein